MSVSPLNSPVVIDGVVSDEKLSALLALQTEYPELDFKETLDLRETGDRVELAKDIGAMQVLGGFIIIGVDDNGVPTGRLDGADLRAFDEASLTQMMLRWLAGPLRLLTRVAEFAGHTVVIIFVGPHPAGCAFFSAVGNYQRNGSNHTAFREGDVFFRDGTRSTRMTHVGLETVIARRVAAAKAEWFEEQRELRVRERAGLEATTEAHRPLGTVNLDMRPREMSLAALEFARTGDQIGLQHLLNDARARARRFIDAGEIEDGLAGLFDSIVCLAAIFLEYEQWGWFERVVDLLRESYSMPLGPDDARRFAHNTRISPDEPAPRIWLQLMTRLYALGGFAVRRRQWRTVRTLTMQLPDRLMDYETNWLRHAITMMSRAQHLQGQQEDRTVELSLLSLAQAQAARLECLRQDGLGPEDEGVLTSLAQFDVLTNIVAVADRPDLDYGKTFYPNFARLRQDRVQSLVNELLTDDGMREALGAEDDNRLAAALGAIERAGYHEGVRYHGFRDWSHTPAADFIAEHLPADE